MEHKPEQFGSSYQVRRLLLSFHSDGCLPFQVVGTVTWGQPEAGLQA